MAPGSAPTRRSVGHARLASLLGDLVTAVDPCREIAGEGRRYEGPDLGPELAGDVEACLIAWPPGTGLGMHDHQGSDAVVTVLRSALRERYVRGGVVRQRSLRPGRPVRLAPDHVHEVVNPGTVEALSLHLYSPPVARTALDWGVG